MSIRNCEFASGSEGHQAVSELSSSGGCRDSTGKNARVVSCPACLDDQELRPVAEMSTRTSRFYVADSALCLVEAVDMTNSPGIDLDEVLERVERKLIKFSLEKTGGARAGAARLMGISRSRLYRRLHALGLDNGAGHDHGTYPAH